MPQLHTPLQQAQGKNMLTKATSMTHSSSQNEQKACGAVAGRVLNNAQLHCHDKREDGAPVSAVSYVAQRQHHTALVAAQ